MKKQLFRKRNVRTVSGGVLAGGILLIFILLFLILRTAFPGVFFSLTAPFWGAGTGVADGFHGMFAGFSRNTDLVRERDDLKAENESLQNKIRTLMNDHALSRELFGADTAEPGVVADVIARPPFSSYDSLLINRGSGDGVASGAVVTANAGVPLGIITSVSKNASRVSLFSSSGTKTDGWTRGTSTPMTLLGLGAGAFEATLPKDAPVEVGDEVYISAQRAPIGLVGSVSSNPSSPTQTVKIQSFVNVFGVRQVLVLPTRSL